MAENINRLNVWSSNLIVDFARMVNQHHESLNNFHRVATMLDASAKIYGLRIDSLYGDVMRMSSGIQRQSLGHSSFDINSTAGTDIVADVSFQYVPPVRRRPITCTTVANSDSINAPLQALAQPNRPLNGTDDISATNLLQHFLPSDRYVWTLHSKEKFWTNLDVANELDAFDELDGRTIVDLPVMNWIPSIADVVRPKLHGYEMADSPCEHFRFSESFTAASANNRTVEIDVDPFNNPEPPVFVPFAAATFTQPDLNANDQNVDKDADLVPTVDPLNNSHPPMPTVDFPLVSVTLNQPDLVENNRNVDAAPVHLHEGNHQNVDDVDMDLQFDMDADPVPVNNSELLLPPIAHSFNEDDRRALQRCSVLRPNTSTVDDDLRPLSSTPLAYSYRRASNVPLPTDAGHWKLPSIIQTTNSEREPARRRRRRRRKVAEKDEPVQLTDAPVGDGVEQNFMSVDDPRTRAIRRSNQDNWQATKLTMPSRMGHASALRFLPLILGSLDNDEPAERTEATAPSEVIDLDAGQDVDVGHDLDAGHDLDVGHDLDAGRDLDAGHDLDAGRDQDADFEFQNEAMDVDMDPVNDPPPNTVDVEMTIADAPNVIPSPNVIPPPMPRTMLHITPANVNVKAIARRCLEIIIELESIGGEATFGQVYRQLEDDGQRVTPALIFSSILELANRHNFRLEKIGDTNDFVIKRI